MIGVNINNINALIKKNNLYLNSFNFDKKKILGLINEFNNCYEGSNLDFLFAELSNSKTNIEKISKVIENYSDILYSVKCSYESQNQNIKTQINSRLQ